MTASVKKDDWTARCKDGQHDCEDILEGISKNSFEACRVAKNAEVRPESTSIYHFINS